MINKELKICDSCGQIHLRKFSLVINKCCLCYDCLKEERIYKCDCCNKYYRGLPAKWIGAAGGDEFIICDYCADYYERIMM